LLGTAETKAATNGLTVVFDVVDDTDVGDNVSRLFF
jgi:hypothetical protein